MLKRVSSSAVKPVKISKVIEYYRERETKSNQKIKQGLFRDLRIFENDNDLLDNFSSSKFEDSSKFCSAFDLGMHETEGP